MNCLDSQSHYCLGCNVIQPPAEHRFFECQDSDGTAIFNTLCWKPLRYKLTL